MRSLFLLCLMACSMLACHPVKRVLLPELETESVESTEDAADDPAIYVDPADAEKSLIIGTNKQKGLVVYNLQGKQVAKLDAGRLNNVDIRQNVQLGKEKITVVGASNRTENTLAIYRFDPVTYALTDILAAPIRSKVDEVYGFCLYHPADDLHAFVVGKDGVVEQWLLTPEGDKLKGSLLRSFDVGGQCEGMVADDFNDVLFVGEEEVGVWKYPAHPAAGEKRVRITTIKNNSKLKADIEGLTLYYNGVDKGYLLVSSQGNNSYAVFEREEPHAYLGSFRLGNGSAVDGTKDTDGIDVTNCALGTAFPNGAFIAQDGYNKDNSQNSNQNFKLIGWKTIAESFDPPLHINTDCQQN